MLDTSHITSVASAGQQDLTLTTPTTVAEGDYLIFVHARSGGVGWGTTDDGLTAGTSVQTGDTSGHLLLRPYTRSADGTEHPTYLWDATATGYRSGLGLRIEGSPTIRDTRSIQSTINGVGFGQSAAPSSGWAAHAGDYGLLVVAATWNSTLSTPTGWTQQLVVEQASSGTASHDLYVFVRSYTAAGPDQPSVTNSGSAASVVGAAWLFAGEPTVSPYVGQWRYRFDTII